MLLFIFIQMNILQRFRNSSRSKNQQNSVHMNLTERRNNSSSKKSRTDSLTLRQSTNKELTTVRAESDEVELLELENQELKLKSMNLESVLNAKMQTELDQGKECQQMKTLFDQLECRINYLVEENERLQSLLDNNAEIKSEIQCLTQEINHYRIRYQHNARF